MTIDRRVELYDDGYSIREIARQVGRSYQGVRQYLIRHGHHHVVTDCRPSAANRRRAVDWYDRGVAVETICSHFGLSQATLYKDVRAAGVAIRYPKMSEAMRRRHAIGKDGRQ